MRWWFYDFHSSKPHVVADPLKVHLANEMINERKHPLRERAPGKPNPEEISVASLDFGGGCYAKRPWEEFELDGLKVHIPSEHLAAFCKQIQELPQRMFGNVPYFKLHGYWQCIVVLPEQHQELLDEMFERLPIAKKRDEEFMASLPPPGPDHPNVLRIPSWDDLLKPPRGRN